ncbi:MAG: glycosyltransferase [Sulfuriferula sp.]
MLLNTNFTGRIFQVIEALDYGDAVSNQVVSLDTLLKDMGFTTSIHSQWRHDDVANLRLDLTELKPTDEDIVILHYAGYSEYALPLIQKLRCTKVCIYHNITPHTFFRSDTDLYSFCLKGRQQLAEIIRDFHYFWGDSNYNLQELVELGADPQNCSLVPIIVGKQTTNTTTENEIPRELGSWLFLGRVAPNKGQVNLIKLFIKVHADAPSCASKLYIVGNHNQADPYYQEVCQQIEKSGLAEHIILTGKVSDAEVERYLARASVYISLSEHEGFGVPLIEAAHHSLPVVALRNSAIGETMGEGNFLAHFIDEMPPLIRELLTNPIRYKQTIQAQKRNAMRFSRESVNKLLIDALQKILPNPYHFTTVSIVICTYNRSDLLERCLDYLQYQTNQNFEIVVINGPSTDNTDEVLKKYKHRIKTADNQERNLSISRNMGIELSDGDIIAFIDDDALPFDDWVDTLIREFSRRPLTLAALGGPAYLAGSLEFQCQDIGINKFAEAKVNIDSSEIGTNGWERSLIGTNTCFRADIIRKVCGFDEQFDYFLDESELCFRLQSKKHLVGYCPDLFLRHEFAQSHNRTGKYKFNWFTICKNTAYYIAAYSGLKGEELSNYIEQRMYDERIRPLKAGLNASEISKAEYKSYVNAIHSGTKQGLIDSSAFPRTRRLNPSPNTFQVFTTAAPYPLVERDIKRLHICIITKEFPPFVPSGGIGTLYYHLASELLLMGHFVTVVAPGDLEPIHRRGRFAIKYTKLKMVCSDTMNTPGFINNINWSISAFQAIATIHTNHPIDIVESALWDSEALALSLIPTNDRPPLVVRLVTPFPVAARLNGWSVPDYEGELFKTSEQTLIANANAVVPISESIANTLEVEYGICRDARWSKSFCGIAYWPFFDFRLGYADLGEINGKPLTFPNNAKLILFVGRLESRKGVDILIAAANEFLKSDSRAHLLLAGRDIEDWISKAKTIISTELANRVHFLGEVDDATRDKLFNIAYCVVFPSRYESFGLVPLEAFVHGVPVIASRAGAIPEVVYDEKCGLLFEPENAKSLADCVTRLLEEPELRKQLSDGAKTQIQYFSSRNSAIRAVKLYSELLNNNKHLLSREPFNVK